MGCGVRAVVLAILACVLCGCSTRDPFVSSASAVPAGNWRIESQVDRITAAPLSSALLVTSSSNSAEPFPHPAMLQLMCFKDQPIVRLSFEFKIGSPKNTVLGYRFDEKPGREIEARYLRDYTTAVIEKSADVAQFVQELATSKLLYVRIRSLNAGRTTAEFRLDGAPAAMEAAFAGCPLSADQKPRRTSAL
jgi:hypothetical protein